MRDTTRRQLTHSKRLKTKEEILKLQTHIANTCCSCDVKTIQSMNSENEFTTSIDCSSLRFVGADAL